MEDCKRSSSVHSKNARFFRRAMNVDTHSYIILKLLTYTRIKRLYFSRIQENYFKNDKRNKFCYSKGKQLNCLTHFKTEFLHPSRITYLVKQSKNLKHIELSFNNESSLSQCIKRLPSNIKTIVIRSTSDTNRKEARNLFKSLSSYREVQVIKMNVKHMGKISANSQHECGLINKYYKRLNRLRELSVDYASDEYFYLIIGQHQVCLYLTGLSTEWSYLKESYPSYLYRKERSKERFKERPKKILSPRLNLFPNLHELSIRIYPDQLYSACSIIDGFKSLNQLKHLKINTITEVTHLEVLFEALIHLPLLDKFDLCMYRLQHHEQKSLTDFLHKQTQLITLKLCFLSYPCFKEHHKEFQGFLEIICQDLNSNYRLKYLCLSAKIWSLEGLSNALSQVKMRNQLKELSIKGFDDGLITSPKPDQAKGLCEFIKRQRLSLRALKITIDLVKEDEIVNSIINAIAEVDKLQTLEIEVNKDSIKLMKEMRILKDIPEKFLRCPLYQKTFGHFDLALRKLGELEKLTLDLNLINSTDDLSYVNSSVVLNALPMMKNLRSLKLWLPCLTKSMSNNPAQALLLSTVKSLSCISMGTCGNEVEVEKVSYSTRVQRFIKGNLAFYPGW